MNYEFCPVPDFMTLDFMTFDFKPTLLSQRRKESFFLEHRLKKYI